MDVADVVRPDPGLVAALGRLATGTLANALDAVGATNSILPTIKSVAPGMRCAGTAVTIRETVGPVGTYESKDFAVGALIDAAEAGDIIVVEGGGLPISTWGGMATCAAVEKGIAGLVVDGGVRELTLLGQITFLKIRPWHLFWRKFVPVFDRRIKGRVRVINIYAQQPRDIFVFGNEIHGFFSTPSGLMKLCRHAIQIICQIR
mgnify:CR=1 FL=1